MKNAFSKLRAVLALTLFAVLGLGAVNVSSIIVRGDLAGGLPNPTVAKVKGTAITTAGGALSTGNVLRVTGVATADWGALQIGDIPTGSSSSTVCIGNDSRLSNARAPTGSAGGDLTGSYPNPTLAASYVKADGSVAFTGDESLGNHKAINLASGTADTDAIAKIQIDNAGWHGPATVLAQVAISPANTYSNGTAGVGATLTATGNGVLTVDGHACMLGDTVIVNAEAAPANNGKYQVTTAGTASVPYVLTRVTSSDEPAKLRGATYAILKGTLYAGRIVTLSSLDTADITIGTTGLTWRIVAPLGDSAMVVASFTQPAIGSTVSVSVDSVPAFAANAAVRLGPNLYTVSGTPTPGATVVTIKNTGVDGNQSATATVAAGLLVASPGTSYTKSVFATTTWPTPDGTTGCRGGWIRPGAGGGSGGGGGGGSTSAATGGGGGGGHGGGGGAPASSERFAGVPWVGGEVLTFTVGAGGSAGSLGSAGAAAGSGGVGTLGGTGGTSSIVGASSGNLINAALAAALTGASGATVVTAATAGTAGAGGTGGTGGAAGANPWGARAIAGSAGTTGGVGGFTAGANGTNTAANGGISIGSHYVFGFLGTLQSSTSSVTGGTGDGVSLGGGGAGGGGGHGGGGDEFPVAGETAAVVTDGRGGTGGHGGAFSNNASLNSAQSACTNGVNGRGGGGGPGGGGGGGGATGQVGGAGQAGCVGSAGLIQIEGVMP